MIVVAPVFAQAAERHSTSGAAVRKQRHEVLCLSAIEGAGGSTVMRDFPVPPTGRDSNLCRIGTTPRPPIFPRLRNNVQSRFAFWTERPEELVASKVE